MLILLLLKEYGIKCRNVYIENENKGEIMLKRKYIAMALIVPTLVSIIPAIGVSAITDVSIIPYENIGGVDTVNLKKLFDALGYKVKQAGNGIEVYVNGRKITYNDSSENISVDDAHEYKKYINSNGECLMDINALNSIGISCVN